MFENIEVLQQQIPGFELPESLRKVIGLNLVDYEHWYLIPPESILKRRNELLMRYPNRNLIPFARRDIGDDIACFELNHGERVFIVHDFASEGWERRQEFDNFWAWYISAMKELMEIE